MEKEPIYKDGEELKLGFAILAVVNLIFVLVTFAVLNFTGYKPLESLALMWGKIEDYWLGIGAVELVAFFIFVLLSFSELENEKRKMEAEKKQNVAQRVRNLRGNHDEN